MIPFINYLLKVIIVSGTLYGYYYFFLRNKTFHAYNRYYLLTSALLACVLPFIHFSFLFSWKENASILYAGLDQQLQTITLTRSNQDASVLTFQQVIFTVYVIVSGFCLVFLTRSLGYLGGLCRRYPYQSIGNMRVYTTDEPGTPFSFFRAIFWNNKIPIESNEGRHVLKHEIYHVKQMHSVDLVVMEVIMTLLWINPFFHLMKKELKTIHEFLADDYALTGADRYEYAELLLLHAMKAKNSHITNLFFHNQIKRRITMITNNSSTSFTYVRRIMVLPFAFVLLIACTRHSDELIGKQETKLSAIAADTVHVSWVELVELAKDKKEFSSRHVNGNVYTSFNNSPKVFVMPFDEFLNPKQEEGMTGIGTYDGTYDHLSKLQKEADYPGGPGGWMRYLNKSFIYPQEAIEKEIQGTVIVQFVVNANGQVSDVEAISGPAVLSAEAIRIIKGSGPWVPGEQDGKKVNSYKKQPITFRLQSE